MPVQLFRSVGVVEDVDGGLLAFFEAQKRARKLAVVGDGGKDVLGRKFDGSNGDVESVVGWLVGGSERGAEKGGDCGGPGKFQKSATRTLR